MIRNWLAGAAAFAMMTGVAFAQSSSTDSTTSSQSTTTSSSPAPAGSYSASKTQTTIDDNGTVTDRSQTLKNGIGGSEASSSLRTKTPDGSQASTRDEERTISPSGDTTTTAKTTSTTTDR